MKIKLVREARIRHYPGEIVEVSPEEARSLITLGSAVRVTEEPTVKKAPPKKEKK